MKNIPISAHIPNKKFGQNFLINQNIINNIIQIINAKYYDKILEIGPGLGSLTYPMSQRVKELIVLEIDKTLLPLLFQNKFKNYVRVILTDAVSFNYNAFFKESNNMLVRFFGNLPYNVSTKFLLYILNFKKNIYDMHFMFQKEVAERILANHNTKKYGRLSIIVQFFFHVTSVLLVEKVNFFPIPKVDSIFLKFSPINRRYKHKISKYISAISYVSKIAFQHRRKILKHSLFHLFDHDILSDFGISSLQRAENISVSKYFQLTEYYIKKNEKCCV